MGNFGGLGRLLILTVGLIYLLLQKSINTCEGNRRSLLEAQVNIELLRLLSKKKIRSRSSEKSWVEEREGENRKIAVKCLIAKKKRARELKNRGSIKGGGNIKTVCYC